MFKRYWIVVIANLSLLPGSVVAELASTMVIRVERDEAATGVILGAGRMDGLEVGDQVTLLRQGAPIVHPLTEEVLGVPQEPVGLARVVEVQERQAQAILVRQYSMPQARDTAEYEREVAAPVPAVQAPDPQMIQRMKKLEDRVAQNRKRSNAARGYPVFAEQVWEELTSIKSYLVSIDERLIALEERQNEDRMRLVSVMNGEYQRQNMKEFTIRYSPEAEVKFKVAGKTLTIDVERDSLQMDMVADPLAMVDKTEKVKKEEEAGWWDKLMGSMEGGEEEEEESPMVMEEEAEDEGWGGDEEEEISWEEEEETEPSAEGGEESAEEEAAWYSSTWMMGGVVLLFVVMAVFVLYDRIFRGSDDLLDDDDFEEYEDDEEE